MTTFWKPHPLDRRDALIGAGVLIGTFALLMATLDMGFTRDESFYFHAAAEYIGWFEDLWTNLWAGNLLESFSKANIDRHWSYNPEHPVLVKTFFALSHKLFYQKLGWMSESAALRLPGAAFGSLAVLSVYAFGRQAFGRLAGAVAVGALLFQPRFFFHAHLTAFDVPITALWAMVVYAYWRAFDSKKWAIAAGVLFGLALSAKLNAFFLPPLLAGHWFLLNWRGIFERIIRRAQTQETDEQASDSRPSLLPWALVSMAIFGPILFHLLWPYHWYDTWARVKWYIEFHLRHEHYFVWYFGQRLYFPPFPIEFPWVMTLVTVPGTVLAAFGLGVWAACRQWRLLAWCKLWWAGIKARQLPDTRRAASGFDPRGTGLLIAINLLFPITLISMPETPVFGGTKHWMPAMIYLAILAGAGVSMAAKMALRAIEDLRVFEDLRAMKEPRAPGDISRDPGVANNVLRSTEKEEKSAQIVENSDISVENADILVENPDILVESADIAPGAPLSSGVHLSPGLSLSSELSLSSVDGAPRNFSEGFVFAALAALLSVMVIGPAVYATWYSHPFGTSYYNELIGSYRGAADAEMMRQFWGYASRQSLPWINEHAPENARVWTHNTTRWAWEMYQRDELARADLRPTGMPASQLGIFHHQRAFQGERMKLWKAYGTRAPSHVVSIDGVPLISVYDRATAPKRKPRRPGSSRKTASHPKKPANLKSTANGPSKENKKTKGDKMSEMRKKPEIYWREKLSPEQYHVLREAGTEAPFSGEYNDFDRPGTYRCAACGEVIFESDAKFASSCGWPSFNAPFKAEGVEEVEDLSHGMRRTEIRCAHCGSHLGHVFNDGPAPTGLRYCINSVAMTFEEA